MSARTFLLTGVVVVLGVVATILITSVSARDSNGIAAPSESMPARPVEQSSTDPYPGGNTPAPVPTQTTIVAGQRVFEGMTGQQISDALITRLEAHGLAVAPTTTITYTTIAPADAPNFGLDSGLVAFQSPTDFAVIFSGSFSTQNPGLYLTPVPAAPYLLMIVDTYSGAARLIEPSDDLQALKDLLP